MTEAKGIDPGATPAESIGEPKWRRRRVRGCLLGGAIGDALGAPVEFLTHSQILAKFGPRGITDYAPAYGRIGAITDDTQITLFTAEGLIRAMVRERLRGIVSVPSVLSHAYLRWLLTQGESPTHTSLEVFQDGWLWGVAGLQARRAPGTTCLAALRAMRRFTDERANNQSKGAGGIMRVAPIACIVGDGSADMAEEVFALAKQAAWLTHGHPTGYLAAAAFAVIVHALLWDMELDDGVERARRLLTAEKGSGETLAAITAGMAHSALDTGASNTNVIASLGEGWVAEEALSIALFCVRQERDFLPAVRLAINHGGDSDTTGSLVGQMIGARDGEHALPPGLRERLELREVIETIADDLTDALAWDLNDDEHPDVVEALWRKYPGV